MIPDDEVLARFVLFERWIRNDNTVKPDAFIPPYGSTPNLSVTRHIGLSNSQIWEIGRGVAATRQLPLHGRADTECSVVKSQELTVSPAPLCDNQNHANIIGWPTSKPEQKIKALEIAKMAVFSGHDV